MNDNVWKMMIDVLWNHCQYTVNNKSDITEQSGLTDELLFDSLDHIECLMELEDKFQIDILYDEYQACNTVGELVELLRSKI